MSQPIERLGVLIERQLQVELGVAEALDAVNAGMSALLDEAGIYGPKPTDLKNLVPLLETLQRRTAESRTSRQTLFGQLQKVPDSSACDSSDSQGEATLKSALDALSAAESTRLEAARQRIRDRILAAQQKLTANQVVIFYSTEFHRRYLLGVLQCDVDEANYQADGQAFRLTPEKIIGRNC